MHSRNKGFTLVEIAIVLVIIGLLLGGILKGQEMITQAKIKNSISDFSGISAAYYGYQDRYRAIPGDDLGAARWTTPTAGIPGDGNGIVDGLYNTACPAAVVAATAESCKWWDHLRRAGFVAGTGGQQPFNAFSGKIGVQTGNGASPPVAAANGIATLQVCSAGIPDKVAIAMDTQMDDGNPAAGTLRGSNTSASGPNPDLAGLASPAYAETGTNTYLICRSL